MSSWLETYKPTASSRTQLWLAGVTWGSVGVALLSVGTYWLLRGADDKNIFLMIIIAACLGLAKTLLVLDRASNGLVERIQLRGEGRCVGGFFSLRLWAIVAVMMLMGRLLRSTSIPRPVLGVIYAAVGVGLLISSRIIWRAWKSFSQAGVSGSKY